MDRQNEAKSFKIVLNLLNAIGNVN
jgi:hypothetical protein